jgi:hypothetical protein
MTQQKEGNRLLEIFGWYGTLAILGAYAFTSLGLMQPRDISYSILNVTGAAGVAAVAWRRRTYQPAVLNTVWCVIGLATALLNLFRR